MYNMIKAYEQEWVFMEKNNENHINDGVQINVVEHGSQCIDGEIKVQHDVEEQRIAEQSATSTQSSVSQKALVAICGLIKSQNLGELFIARSLEYLIRTECEKRGLTIPIEFVEVDILGRNDDIKAVQGAKNKRIAEKYAYRKIGIPAEAFMLFLKKLAAKTKRRSI